MYPMSSIRNANGKREIESIDLTGSDDVPWESRPRKTARQNPTNGASQSQSQRDSLLTPPSTQVSSQEPSQSQREAWDDEDEADAVIVLSQDSDNTASESFELYGTLSTKIVGVQYYKGHATVGEFVTLRREPSNPYDSNAIRIDNVRREQIGHIPRQIASRLARYMDAGTLLVEGSLAGLKSTYDCPIALRLYGTSDPAERESLKNRMKRDYLPVDALDLREREEKRRQAEQKKRQAEELKRLQAARREEIKRIREGRGGRPGGGQQREVPSSQTGYVGSTPSVNVPQVQTIEEIMRGSQKFNPREVGEVVEKFGAGEDALAQMPMADFPKKLSTKLLPYQRQALAWLLEKENPQLPPVGSDDVVQMWKRSAPNLFTNIATHFTLKGQDPILASGGILADDMGLGKTLEMIALIVADNRISGSNTTLIVAPMGVMSNWTGQIAHHVHSHSALRVFTYHRLGKKQMTPAELSAYDVVLTTYGTLASDYAPRKSKGTTSEPPTSKVPSSEPRTHGLYSMKWRRVILDEGHQIRNTNTNYAQAAAGLFAQSRWVLTGTPIINTLKDLHSLVKFIGLTGGLEQSEIFNSVLIRPLNQGYEAAEVLLQALMGTICLRRKKEMKFIEIKLPELTEYVHKIEFLPHEKEKYQALQAEAQGLVQRVKTGNAQTDSYRNLLEILLRLRQVCNHWKLCGDRISSLLSALETEKVVELTPENRQALQDMLQLSIDSREECSVCLEDLRKPAITACSHVFCSACIERVIEIQHRCPLCRAEPLELDSLVKPAAELGESAEADIDIDTTSSKVEALLSILKASHQKPGTKIVIFSQWTSFLDIIQKQLTAHDYKLARIDGKMSPKARDAAMSALESDPECTIMLASLAVCSVGLNLVAANQVILADSWWAPAIEDQAVDRVHRLGQKRPTTVWRLVMEGSIEESVLEIQAQKRKLMLTAFREKGGKRAAGGKMARLADIERLLR